MQVSSAASSKRLVKMSVLSKLAGVPAATIKHYLREGLLPPPAQRTGRTGALYDVGLVDRIQQIKALQREQFLPLRLIKAALDGAKPEEMDAVAAAAIERALEAMAPRETRTREALIASGLSPNDLAFLESRGLIVATDGAFTGDDLALLRLLGRARRAGITREMLPIAILDRYVRAVAELARVEIDLFRDGILPRAGADVGPITEAATRLSETLVILLRRRLLVPALRAAAVAAKT